MSVADGLIQYAFKINGHAFIFSAIFTKGDNFRDFLFASLEEKYLKKVVCS